MLIGIASWVDIHKDHRMIGTRSWFSCPELKVYLRMAMHKCAPMDQGLRPTIDIASIDVNENCKGKGLFTLILTFL